MINIDPNFLLWWSTIVSSLFWEVKKQNHCLVSFSFPLLILVSRFFPTCQVRVVRFYVSCLLLSSSPLLLLLLNRDPRRTVFSVGPQPRPSTPSVPCRTSTTTIHAQWSLPDLNREYPRQVFTPRMVGITRSKVIS